MKGLVLGVALACAGVAGMAGGALARPMHGTHNGNDAPAPSVPIGVPIICAFNSKSDIIAPCCPLNAYCIQFPSGNP